MLGFIVYYLQKREINIVDWFCPSRNNELVVLAKLIKQLSDQGDKINILLVNINNKEAQLMGRLGFWNSANRVFKRPTSPLITYSLNTTIEPKLHAPEKWLLRFIDSDTIIS